jgi:hypothetical protein
MSIPRALFVRLPKVFLANFKLLPGFFPLFENLELA